MRPEYDFRGGVRGKYAKSLREDGYTIRIYHDDGTFTEEHVLAEMAVILEPDVWAYFPNSKAVNRALRTLISLIPTKRKTASKKTPSIREGKKSSARSRIKTVK